MNVEKISKVIQELEKYFCNTEIVLISNKMSDDVYDGNNRYKSYSFQIAYCVDILQNVNKIIQSEIISHTIDKMTKLLYEWYLLYGFRYANGFIFPCDLDTASNMTRALYKHEDVVQTYIELVRRNILDSGMVPTWLDTCEHSKYKTGKYIFHADVILNYWLTCNILNIPVMEYHVEYLKRKTSLKTYWYLTPMYTSYLLAKLLHYHEREDIVCVCRKSISEIAKSWKNRINDDRLYDDNDAFKLKRIKNDSINNIINMYMYYAYCSKCGISNRYYESQLKSDNILTDDLCGLYWTTGYKKYISHLLAVLIKLECMTIAA